MTIALPNNYIKKTPFWADSFELVNLRDLQASSFLEKWFPTFSFSTFSCASVPVSVRERRKKKESNPLVIFAISELRYFQREYICDLWVARFSTRISLWSLSCEIFNENILTRGEPIVHWSGDWRERETEVGGLPSLCEKPPVQIIWCWKPDKCHFSGTFLAVHNSSIGDLVTH